MAKRVLLTGFGDFNDQVNHTPRIAEAVATAGVEGAEIRTSTFPVVWDAVPAQLEDLVRSFSPDIILNLGLAKPFQEIHAERFAINWAAGVDISQRTPATPVLPGIADRACLDLSYDAGRVAREISDARIPAEASGSIGAYLCNYLALHARLLVDKGYAEQSGFVHLPAPETLDSARQVEAIRIAVRSCLEGRGAGKQEPYLLLRYCPLQKQAVALSYTRFDGTRENVGIAAFVPQGDSLERIASGPDGEAIEALRARGSTFAYSVLPSQGFFDLSFSRKRMSDGWEQYGPLTLRQQQLVREAGLTLVWFDAEINRALPRAEDYAPRIALGG